MSNYMAFDTPTRIHVSDTAKTSSRWSRIRSCIATPLLPVLPMLCDPNLTDDIGPEFGAIVNNICYASNDDSIDRCCCGQNGTPDDARAHYLQC